MFQNRRASLVLAVALTAAAAQQASAESRAWTAAKKALPANLLGVGGINFGPIKSSQLFQQLLPMAMASQPDAQAKLDAFKAECGFDPMTAFDSAVIGMVGEDKGAIVVALNGTQQKDIDACITKMAKANGKAATISKAGALTKYAGLGKDFYLKWLSTDSFAIATAPDDKALLTKLTGGGIAGDKALKTALATVNTDAAVWGAGHKTQDLPDIHAKMTGLYGSADVKSGTISAELHAQLDSAKAATDAAAQANQQLSAVKSSGGLPPALAGALGSVAVKAAGSEVVVTGSIAEKDVMNILMSFGGMMQGGGAGAKPAPAPAPTTPPAKSSGGGLKPH
jgi:hypothetical protein